MRKFLIVLFMLASTTAACASAFWHGTVKGVAYNDVLNVRKWPSSQSRISDGYNNGEDVSLTGRCKNTVTYASFRVDNRQSAAWKRERMQRPNVWCQVVTDVGQVGWVRGSFVRAD
jgi:uncharacterized protein YgiM (DUF1202 family)